METHKKERGRIAPKGMGCLMCPPTHPALTSHIELDLRKLPVNRGGVSLEYAATDAHIAEWLHPDTIAEARAVLAAWDRPPIERADVQEWVRQVLGYFRNCYRADESVPEPECWNASNLRILKAGETLPVELHAGVHTIRRYYPEFQPTEAHFTEAYWGTKPTASATA